MKFGYCVFRKSAEEIRVFFLNLTRVTGTSNKDQCLFVIISLSALLRMRNVSNRIIEKIKTHILCSVTSFRTLCCLWDIVEKIY
jgi:preprotein translocase subunit Sec63